MHSTSCISPGSIPNIDLTLPHGKHSCVAAFDTSTDDGDT